MLPISAIQPIFTIFGRIPHADMIIIFLIVIIVPLIVHKIVDKRKRKNNLTLYAALEQLITTNKVWKVESLTFKQNRDKMTRNWVEPSLFLSATELGLFFHKIGPLFFITGSETFQTCDVYAASVDNKKWLYDRVTIRNILCLKDLDSLELQSIIPDLILFDLIAMVRAEQSLDNKFDNKQNTQFNNMFLDTKSFVKQTFFLTKLLHAENSIVTPAKNFVLGSRSSNRYLSISGNTPVTNQLYIALFIYQIGVSDYPDQSFTFDIKLVKFMLKETEAFYKEISKLPLAEKLAKEQQLHQYVCHKDTFVKQHPVFNGLSYDYVISLMLTEK